jgi:7-keto-8-aminopelargonate synthetase-like enzyme
MTSITDDAHSTGTVGKSGRGTIEYYNLADWEDHIIIMGTLGKALGSIGGFVTAQRDIIEVLKYTANQIIYSTSLTPPSVAAALTALQTIRSDPSLVEKLQDNTKKIIKGISDLGLFIGSTKTHIIPLMLCADKIHYCQEEVEKIIMLSQMLIDHGYYAPPITKPAVQVPRLRISVSTKHTDTQINGLLNSLAYNIQLLNKQSKNEVYND